MLRQSRHGKRAVGVRMVVLTIIISSVATLVITVLQLFSDYRQQVEDLERRLDEVKVLLPSFAASVWTFNDRQLQLGLKALVSLPDIEYAAVATLSGDGHWSEGASPSRRMERSYPLDYTVNGSNRQLGTLWVSASLNAIYRRLATRALVQLGSNGIKTFLVAGFMLVLFRRLVTDRLVRLERRMADLAPQMNLASNARDAADLPVRPPGGDEIDSLDDGFVIMADQLIWAVRRLQQAEADLRAANTQLNQRVLERTAELETANHFLTEAKQQAEAAAEAEHRMRLELRNFLTMVSHEFRLPLSIIGASGQLLSLLGKLDGETREEAAKILRAVGRLTALLDVCLTDERLDAGEVLLQPAMIDISALVRDLCGEFAREMPGRVTLSSRGSPVMIQADGGLLRIALSNLLDNAIKYSSPAVPVAVSLGFQDSSISIVVEDHGTGISSDDKTRIFEKYFRSNKVDGIRGAGLGLYIVKRIIDLHCGTISVESQLGSGTTITIHLPCLDHGACRLPI